MLCTVGYKVEVVMGWIARTGEVVKAGVPEVRVCEVLRECVVLEMTTRAVGFFFF